LRSDKFPGPVNGPSSETAEPDEELDAWLQSVGLAFNPFVLLEAGADSRLSTYLVGHGAFDDLWGDWPAVLFAPAGGGKSAFRVRLAYACRAGEDGRRVFPILYHFPRGPLSLDKHLQAISRAAAHELLLELAWRPGWFEALDPAARGEMRRVFDWNAPHLLDQLLPQLREEGSPKPIVINYDPSAAHLPNPPSPARVRALCDALQSLPTTAEPPPPPQERFNHLLHVTFSLLKRKAAYILVDSVDAHPETIHEPATALTWLRPLLDHFSAWEEQAVFPKLFLPKELYNLFKNKNGRKLLTSQTKSAKIVKVEWTPERLADMLQSRVRVASEGEFYSLDAISSPALHRVEQALIAEAMLNPRELLVLAGRVLLEHVRRAGPTGLLEPQDLQKAINFFKSNNKEP
jgi:hypothetical protein